LRGEVQEEKHQEQGERFFSSKDPFVAGNLSYGS